MTVLDYIFQEFAKLYKEEYGSLQNDRPLGYYGAVGMIKTALKGKDFGEMKCSIGCDVEPSKEGNFCLNCGRGISVTVFSRCTECLDKATGHSGNGNF